MKQYEWKNVGKECTAWRYCVHDKEGEPDMSRCNALLFVVNDVVLAEVYTSVVGLPDSFKGPPGYQPSISCQGNFVDLEHGKREIENLVANLDDVRLR